MRDRLPALTEGLLPAAQRAPDLVADAEAALIGLGYKPQEAARALGQIEDQDVSVERLIRQALKSLA